MFNEATFQEIHLPSSGNVNNDFYQFYLFHSVSYRFDELVSI